MQNNKTIYLCMCVRVECIQLNARKKNSSLPKDVCARDAMRASKILWAFNFVVVENS